MSYEIHRQTAFDLFLSNLLWPEKCMGRKIQKTGTGTQYSLFLVLIAGFKIRRDQEDFVEPPWGAGLAQR